MASFVVAYPTIFKHLCKTFLILRRTDRDVIIDLHMSSYKIRTVGRTDMTKLIVAFSNFANALKVTS